jgi:outer membrane receptor protein involved in Fe transport
MLSVMAGKRSGNPDLLPAITDNISVGYTFRKKLLSFSYGYEKNPITNFSPKVDPKTNIETLAAQNQKYSRTYSVSLSLPIDITKWWNLQMNINGQYQQLQGVYLGEEVHLESKSIVLNATQNIQIPKDYSLSVSGFYRSPSLWGVYKFNAIGSLDIGMQKKFKDQKSSLRLNAGNILNTLVFKPSVNIPEKNLITNAQLNFIYPEYRLTFTHTFGNDKLTGKRNRSTRTEDEQERLKQQ